VAVGEVLLLTPPTPLGVGVYALRATEGAIADLHGNAHAWWTSEEHLRWEVKNNGVNASLELLAMSPENMGMANDTVKLYFSETLNFTTATMDIQSMLVDCGPDLVCGTKDDTDFSDVALLATHSIAADPYVLVNGSTATLNIGTTLTAFRRYTWRLRAGVLRGMSSHSTEIDFEFMQAAGAFTEAMAVAGGATGSGFPITAPTGGPIDYEVCWCNPHSDASLRDMDDGAWTYQARTQPAKCFTDFALTTTTTTTGNATTPIVLASDVTPDVEILGRPLMEHACASKCRTCQGPECYCPTGWVSDPDPGVLCLPEDLCRSACDQLGHFCLGYSVPHDGTTLCSLATSDSECIADLSYATLDKVDGTACTDVDDFMPAKSSFHTSTVLAEMDLDFVVPPNKLIDLDVALLEAGDVSVVDMRLLIVGEDDACGRSEPAAGARKDFKEWASLVPERLFSADPLDFVPCAEARMYHVREGRFCPNANMPVAEFPEFVKPFTCFRQCSGPCTNPNGCTCGGYLQSYDSETSASLCVTHETCRALCDATEDCDSYEIDSELHRCFLNKRGNCGEYHEDRLSKRAETHLWVAKHDWNQETGGEKGACVTGTGGAYLDHTLIFRGITLAAGQYKVCFCDTPPCAALDDFRLTLGRAHASGVSCLLENPRLRAVSECAALPSTSDDPGYRCKD
jgi:hypothetical protein